jgi:hypothetical protein
MAATTAYARIMVDGSALASHYETSRVNWVAMIIDRIDPIALRLPINRPAGADAWASRSISESV